MQAILKFSDVENQNFRRKLEKALPELDFRNAIIVKPPEESQPRGVHPNFNSMEKSIPASAPIASAPPPPEAQSASLGSRLSALTRWMLRPWRDLSEYSGAELSERGARLSYEYGVACLDNRKADRLRTLQEAVSAFTYPLRFRTGGQKAS